MDELMHSLCCGLNLELLPKQGTTFGTKDAGCKFIVMKFCLMCSGLCLPSHTYMLLRLISYAFRYSTKKYRRL